MAIFNELQVGRYNRLAQKLFSMKGDAAVNALISELAFTLACFHGVENRYLEAWDLFGAGFLVGAQGVGNASTLEVRNPTGSNVIAVVQSALVGALVTGTFNLATGALTTDQTIQTGNFRMDRRGRNAPTCIVSIGSQGGLNDWKSIPIIANTGFEFIWHEEMEIPLLPGDACLLKSLATNQSANLNLSWRERFLEESERA